MKKYSFAAYAETTQGQSRAVSFRTNYNEREIIEDIAEGIVANNPTLTELQTDPQTKEKCIYRLS